MMNCGFERELLEKYCDGEADALEHLVVECHIRLCTDCAAVCAELKWLHLRLAELGPSLTYPQELSSLSRRTANSLTADPGIRRVWLDAAVNSSRYLRYIPGAPRASELARRGLRAAPRAALGLAGYMVRGGARLVQVIT